MNFKYIFGALFLFLLASTFVLYNKRDLGLRSTSQLYVFSNLEKNQAALVRFRGTALQAASPYIVPFDEILDEHYLSLHQKKEELLFISALQQFIKPNMKTASFALQKPKRPLIEICNQYQTNCYTKLKVSFAPTQDVFLKTDQGDYKLEQLDQSNLHLRATYSESLDHILKKIDEKIRTKTLYYLAKLEQITVPEYIEKYIVKSADVLKYVEQEMSYKGVAGSEKTRMLAGRAEQKKQMMIDEFLKKNYIQPPIAVNVYQPHYEFESRWEWTPFFGSAPRKNSFHVILFADFFSEASRNLLENFLKYQKQNIDATFAFRPFFPAQDQMQRMMAEISFCVWKENKDAYWGLLQQFINFKREFLEEDLYQAVEKLGLPVEPIKKCFLQRSTKEAVDYHLQTAQYMKMLNAPVLFIGNEVYIGPLSKADLERIIARQK